jgi:hypothetical protein
MLPETTRLAKTIQVLSPPSTKRDRIVSVDDDLLPNEISVEHSATSVSQADPSTDAEPSYAGPALVAIGDRDLDPVRSVSFPAQRRIAAERQVDSRRHSNAACLVKQAGTGPGGTREGQTSA